MLTYYPLTRPPSYITILKEMDHAVMDHFTTEAMKLGAQGVTIVAATGDDGVAGYKARNDTAQCKYTASFPATCPYVTSVGGTQNAGEFILLFTATFLCDLC